MDTFVCTCHPESIVINSPGNKKSSAIFYLVVAMMSKQWRILIVLDEVYLNRSIVNSLQIDGYFVKGVASATEAVHLLWAEEYDIVVSDQKMPDSDGFELLQWMRTYRPSTRMIMIGMPGSSVTRTQALENGVVSYLEKPLDLHLLKEELRRLLQQTGFSASLDSFDLLDVIQIITMSRKNIALVVNTGLEEQGILRFQGGELIWAEYGVLRGEEAFFALAAHKNGTVIHQPWNEQIAPNVTQPLSRLIFQALQYRSKYAAMQQPTGEQEAIAHTAVTLADALDDDRPFITLETVQDDGFDEAFEVFKEHVEDEEMVSRGKGNNEYSGSAENNEAAEWWQQPAVMPPVSKSNGDGQTVTDPAPAKPVPDALPVANAADITPSTVRKTTASQRSDLPSWLIEQPTQSDMPRLRPSSLSNSDPGTVAPASKPSPAEWQPTVPRSRITEQLPRKQSTGAQKPLPKTTGKNTPSSPEWTPPEQETPSNGHLQSLSPSRETSGALPVEELREGDSPTLTK